MVRMRYVGRCLLVLLLIGFGGLLANVTVSDVTGSGGGDHGGGGQDKGGGVPLVDDGVFLGAAGGGGAGGFHVDLMMKMKMRPVPVSEFQARLRTVRNKFDMLRIFLTDSDISDDSLRRILAASMLASRPHNPDAQNGVREDDETHPPSKKDMARAITPPPPPSYSSSNDDDRGTEKRVSQDKTSLHRHHRRNHPRRRKYNDDNNDNDGDNDDSQQLSEVYKREEQQPPPSSSSAPSSSSLSFANDTNDEQHPPPSSSSSPSSANDTNDDDEFGEDEEEIAEEDYEDGEEDYYNDAAQADAILEELEAAAHHVMEMENNPRVQCRDPLPQVVHIEDPTHQNRQFYPECTLIHRCRNDSGCCGRDYVCGPKFEQVIFRTFLAVSVNASAHTVLPNAQMVERIALVNHTECQCIEKPRLPDCNQQCPGVFRMYRHGSQCVCDCSSSNNQRFPQCDDVKEGLLSLSPEDLVCIRTGTCGAPRCSRGQFDVNSGFCPLSDLYSIPSPLLIERIRQQHLQRQQEQGRRLRQRSHSHSHQGSSSSRNSSHRSVASGDDHGVPVEGSGDL